MRKYWNEHYRENNAHYLNLRHARLADMTQEQRDNRSRERAIQRAEYYDAVKADPERYAQRMEGIRARRAARAIECFMADANMLIEREAKE